ncbi:MAG: TOBE domain-containing protein [Syntrophomonadaceae bacterium]|nr:TOBE domain-containing protein [Syntrophomonadaceae bacterium]
MKISGRNKIPGVIKEIKLGEVAAEVIINSGSNEIVASITRGSVEDMGLKVGDNVTALIKASSVMVMK